MNGIGLMKKFYPCNIRRITTNIHGRIWRLCYTHVRKPLFISVLIGAIVMLMIINSTGRQNVRILTKPRQHTAKVSFNYSRHVFGHDMDQYVLAMDETKKTIEQFANVNEFIVNGERDNHNTNVSVSDNNIGHDSNNMKISQQYDQINRRTNLPDMASNTLRNDNRLKYTMKEASGFIHQHNIGYAKEATNTQLRQHTDINDIDVGSEISGHGFVSDENRIDNIIGHDQMLNHAIYRQCLEPDDWQMVEKHITYVYVAYLNPDSNQTRSIVEVIGTMRQQEWDDDDDTHRNAMQCRLWYWDSGKGDPTEIHTNVDEIVLHYGVRG